MYRVADPRTLPSSELTVRRRLKITVTRRFPQAGNINLGRGYAHLPAAEITPFTTTERRANLSFYNHRQLPSNPEVIPALRSVKRELDYGSVLGIHTRRCRRRIENMSWGSVCHGEQPPIPDFTLQSTPTSSETAARRIQEHRHPPVPARWADQPPLRLPSGKFGPLVASSVSVL